MSDDLISRQAAINVLEELKELDYELYIRTGYSHLTEDHWDFVIKRYKEAIKETLRAQPKQKTYQWGRQILFNDGCGDVKVGYACPACKTYVPNKGNYCSNCGAKFTKR